jgi:hypothetical protein
MGSFRSALFRVGVVIRNPTAEPGVSTFTSVTEAKRWKPSDRSSAGNAGHVVHHRNPAVIKHQPCVQTHMFVIDLTYPVAPFEYLIEPRGIFRPQGAVQDVGNLLEELFVIKIKLRHTYGALHGCTLTFSSRSA